MNTLDNQYQALLERVLEYGTQKNDRTGTGTLSVFGGQFIHDMSEGFPLLTTKKMAIKTMMTELKWFLKGDTNIKYLVDNGCNIWNGDAYKAYEKYALANSYGVDILSMDEFINEIKTNDEFAKKWGELGPIYGKQWRSWDVEYHFDNKGSIDQIANLINDLKNNPDSRRLMVSAWNVGELDGMTLPPCHYGFQCYVSEGKLSLMWNQRSVDTFLGLPFNIASYGTLLLLLCEETGYQPGMLIGNLGDIHIYNNHIDAVNEQLSRSSFELPIIEFSNVDILNGEFDYKLNGYESHPSIKAPLSN
jgi:thymidylate synthase